MSEQKESPEYKGLDALLHKVRWSQHMLSIVAEVLILLSFAMSGMDVSLGGVMASVPLLKILWAAMFALGIDTAFALNWVRVRQNTLKRQWGALIWNMLLALSMSLVIFQPLALQLLQQSLGIDFNQALANLGVNIVFLTYARSGVAVFLGAILAMTNVESETATEQVSTRPKRRIILFDRMLNRIAPVVSTDNVETKQVTVTEETPAQLEVPPEQELIVPELPANEVGEPEQETTGNILRFHTTQRPQAAEIPIIDMVGLSTYEKVVKVVTVLPTISDRELGKICGCAAATAKKHRERLKREQTIKVVESEE